LLSDKFKTRIGSRAPWYIVGTIIVLPTFLGIFIYPPFEHGSETQIAYYIILPAVFNVGWAFVQISNMALVNSITFSTQRRDRLISLRNGFTFVANLSVLTIALALFSLIKDQPLQFRLLAIIIVVGGAVSSLFYIFTLKEPALVKEAKSL
jgi:glycoside/pentoside/hexuronide:cation symporter, GPH family